jgi:hypothetical protein
MRLKVKNEPGLIRDTRSGAIINVDDSSYNKYKEAKQRLATQKEESLMYKQQIEQLRCEFDEVKCLISKLISRLDNKE